jgi:actin-related protein 2
VSNWDDMGLVWKHGLNLIGVNDCRGRSCLLTEPVMNPHKNREKMAEIIFENFEFGRMFIGV